jgi:membrane-bound metal-dependent hydrolase YbcI (DUF457 family)
MLSKTHIASGLTFGLAAIVSDKIDLNEFKFFSGIILGSVLPDIDTQKSWISQIVPYIDSMLRKSGILKHRGITHSIFVVISMIVACYFFRDSFLIGITVGYSVHCFSDKILTNLKIQISQKNDDVLFNLFWFVNFLLITVIVLQNKGVI